MPEFVIEERAPRHALAVHCSTPVEEIPATLPGALHEAWAAAEALGLDPDGPPYARYFSGWTGPVEYEGGVTVPAATPAGQGRAVPTELPGGLVAVGWHVGPYTTLGETYAALLAWIAAQGRTAAGPMWEVYWTDPDAAPPDEWRTEVLIPVA